MMRHELKLAATPELKLGYYIRARARNATLYVSVSRMSKERIHI
jgi:hypothetical protein